MTLGERIRKCRQNSGLSQDKVAELMGVSRQAVTKWEAGQSAPSTENLFKLAQLFGTTVDLLLSPTQTDNDSGESGGVGNSKLGAAIKKNVLTAGCVLGAYLLIYLLMQLTAGNPQDSSILGMLLSTDSRLYLWGWLLHSRLFWAGLCLAAAAALLGKQLFAAVTSVLFFLGIFLGELLGPYPAGSFYGQSHYGWAIWGGVYLVAILMGAAAEKLKARGVLLRSKAGAVWLCVTIAGCIAVILAVLLTRPNIAA